MLRHLIYPFLPYRSLFYPFFVACAVVVPCWLAFRLYRRRASRERSSLPRELLLLVFVVYLSGLASATLTPDRPSREVAEAARAITLRPDATSLTCSSASMPEGSRARGFCVRNAQGNVALFFPLGFLLPLVWRRLRFRDGLLIALGVSVGIELLQYVSRAIGSLRNADVNDVILNVAGAALGLVLGSLVRRVTQTSLD
jgi:glycopeptide antibiotics resistance protein